MPVPTCRCLGSTSARPFPIPHSALRIPH